MKFTSRYLLAAALLLTISSTTIGQTTPSERCTALLDGNVCLDCTHYDVCKNGSLATIDGSGLPNACYPAGSVCDDSVISGTCFTPISSSNSECFCSKVGCFTDPNNPSTFLQCTGTEQAGSIPTACDYSAEQFNITSCQCDSIVCPSCGLIAADTSTCPGEYYYCKGSTAKGPLNCGDHQCFIGNSNSCGCETITSTTTSSSSDISAKSTSNSKTTQLAITCLSCGLAKNPGSDCSLYYSCNTNDGTITGTYNCPGTLCFDEATCDCT